MSTPSLPTPETRQRLHDIVRKQIPFDTKAHEALEVVAQYLNVDHGYVTRIDTDMSHWEVVVTTDTDGQTPLGLEHDLTDTYCRETIEEENCLALHDVPSQGRADDPALDTRGHHSYLGIPLILDDEVYGTVCFVGEEPRSDPFTDAEIMFAEQLTRLLERELARDNIAADLTSQTNLATVLNRVLRHNLRNDISVIRGYTELIAEQFDDESTVETILRHIDELIELSEKARELEDILSTSSERQYTELSTLVEAVVKRVATEHPTAEISIESSDEIHAGVLPNFDRALEELVQNAVKHSGETPTVTVTVEVVPQAVEIQIVDNGPGLPDAECKVLDSGSETPLIHGSGLGLWLAHWIVTSHNGSLEPTVTDRGTTMTVQIPREPTIGVQYQLTELTRSRDKYKAAFEQADEAITFVNDDGQILDANSAAEALYGLDTRELSGRRLFEFLPEELKSEGVWQEFQNTSIERATATIVSADGKERIVEVSGTTDIVPGQHLLVCRDVTEQIGYEKQLELADTVFQNTQDALFLIDVTGDDEFRIQRVNDVYESLTGLSNDNITGQTPREVVGDEIGGEIESRYRECVKKQETVQYEENIPVDGEPRQWQTKLTPIIKDGTVTGLVGAMRDVTDQKQRERKLRGVNSKLQTVLEKITAAVFIKDTEGRYQLVNQRFRELLDVGSDESIEGLTDYDLFEDEVAKSNRNDDKRVVERGETIKIKEEIPTSEGDRTFLTVKSPITDDNGAVSGICAVATDITHREEREQLRRQNERLGEFASVISHDLRNPLNVASARLELAQKECDNQHLAEIKDAHDRIETLINDLLTQAREGLRATEIESVALASLVQNCWHTVKTSSATLTIDTEQTIKADRSRLRQLFENLIRNAIEHGDEEVQLTIGDLEDRAGFYVADDGPGIPASDREQVFETGFSTQPNGTGLGLAIVKAIVQDHGWEITVTDSESGGARFEITGVDIS